MHFNALVSTSILLLVPSVLAQVGFATNLPKYTSDINSYKANITAGSSVASMYSEIESIIGTASASAVAYYNVNPDALTSNPVLSSLFAARTTAWESALPTALRSSWDALQTSMLYEEETIARHDFGIGAAGNTKPALLLGSVAAMVAVGVGAVWL